MNSTRCLLSLQHPQFTKRRLLQTSLTLPHASRGVPAGTAGALLDVEGTATATPAQSVRLVAAATWQAPGKGFIRIVLWRLLLARRYSAPQKRSMATLTVPFLAPFTHRRNQYPCRTFPWCWLGLTKKGRQDGSRRICLHPNVATAQTPLFLQGIWKSRNRKNVMKFLRGSLRQQAFLGAARRSSGLFRALHGRHHDYSRKLPGTVNSGLAGAGIRII